MSRLAMVSCALLAFGCSDTIETEQVPVDLGEGINVDLGTSPDRARRRMDVDQLEASIVRVTNGITWMSGSTNQFTRFRATLGVPDFVETTNEDLDTSLLFLKFLDDASRAVCDDLLEREEAGMEERVFLVHVGPEDVPPTADAAIGQNLAYLLLRFHGRDVAADGPALERWRRLFDTAYGASEDDPVAAWQAVCVGLIDHPDFYTY